MITMPALVRRFRSFQVAKSYINDLHADPPLLLSPATLNVVPVYGTACGYHTIPSPPIACLCLFLRLWDSQSLTVPNFIMVFGDVLDELNGDDILDEVSRLTIVFAVTGAVSFLAGMFMVRLALASMRSTKEFESWLPSIKHGEIGLLWALSRHTGSDRMLVVRPCVAKCISHNAGGTRVVCVKVFKGSSINGDFLCPSHTVVPYCAVGPTFVRRRTSPTIVDEGSLVPV